MSKQSAQILDGVRRVFWDMDGTIIDSEPLHYEAFRRTLLPHVLSAEQYASFFYGTTDLEGFVAIHAALGTPPPGAWQEFLATKQRLFTELLASEIPVLPGVDAILAEVAARNIPQCVFTSSDEVTASRMLRAAGVHHWFDAVLSAEAAGSKRTRSTYDALVLQFGLVPQDCLLLDDNDQVLDTAARAGWRTYATQPATWALQLAV